MALLKKKRPYIWEGENCVDLIEAYAPWAADACIGHCQVQGVCCAVVTSPDGRTHLQAISDEFPLNLCRHYVAAVAAPMPLDAAAWKDTLTCQAFYQSRGIALLGSVVDGDCGIDVMNMMLDKPQSMDARTELRIELSDYLMDRVGERWMQDLMVTCEELDANLVKLSRSGCAPDVVDLSAVADALPSEVQAVVDAADAPIVAHERMPTDEEMEALRWACNLRDDGIIRNLARELPTHVVEEQVAKYKIASAESNASERARKMIRVPPHPTCSVRAQVAAALQSHCKANGIVDPMRMPIKVVHAWVVANLDWHLRSSARLVSQTVKRWYAQWVRNTADSSAVAELEEQVRAPQSRKQSPNAWNGVAPWKRQRVVGAGRRRQATIIGHELYEWWVGLRYAINWDVLAAHNRSRGKRCLARFPRSAIKTQVLTLLQDHAYASLVNGKDVKAFQPTTRWLRQWEHDYGLSMRKANRKYEVPRHVLKERLHIGWGNIFRIRKLILDTFGYEPTILNWDQSPYHNNETGSQDKPVLNVKGAKAPVVEGKDDVRMRWTANLTTISCSRGILEGQMPPVECLFKGESEGKLKEKLTAHIRSRGFPNWFSVACSPRGSYREDDIIEFLNKHLEPWKPGRDWRIILADDFAPHKSANVRRACWNNGYVLLVHGGGATPVVQTVDTDLNEHVRRAYAAIETRLLVDKMRSGVAVPKASQVECLEIMREVLSDPAIHVAAVAGYKKTGITVDLHGKEDCLIVREAAQFWSERTSDGFANMREKLNYELSAVADEYKSGSLTWSKQSVERLIVPFPKNKEADAILERIGDHAGVDDLHGAICDEAINAALDGADSSDSDAEIEPGGEDKHTTSTLESGAPMADVSSAVADEVAIEEYAPILSVAQAEVADSCMAVIAGLQDAHDACLRVGAISSAHSLEAEIAKLKRRQRALIAEDDAVADAFLRRRQADAKEAERKRRLADELNHTVLVAQKAKEEQRAAVAALKKTKEELKRCEAVLETQHAMKTFTLEMLGKGDAKGGGAAARKLRFEVMDRMARIGAGLSPAQRNDFAAFKHAWDAAMLEKHRGDWAMKFLSWMQAMLDNKDSNAFSQFVWRESCTLFHGTVALHVP